jgi:hypothetical protein
MADRTLDWRDELRRWLKPFLARWATGGGDRILAEGHSFTPRAAGVAKLAAVAAMKARRSGAVI